MAIQTMELSAQRIGISLGRILPHANAKITLGVVGMQKDIRKKNTGGTTKYRRVLPKGATASNPNKFTEDGNGDRTAAYVAAQQTSEGVTPLAETLSFQDFTVEQKQLHVLYGYNDKVADLYEDPIPREMEELVGERVGLICEWQLFGVLKACPNKFYGGTGISRTTVNGLITLPLLRRVARSLMANHSEPVRKMFQAIPAEGKYNTTPIGSFCLPVFISTDLINDVSDLPKFIPVENYPDQMKAVENEIGSCERFRFIASPDLIEIQNAGALVAGSNPPLKTTTPGSNAVADVYQVIVGSNDAWSHLSLQGMDKSNLTLLPTGQKDKGDPFGQRGYVGAMFYYNAVRLNEGQMAVIEVGANALTS